MKRKAIRYPLSAIRADGGYNFIATSPPIVLSVDDHGVLDFSFG